MKSKEALKSICLECEREKGKNKIACPFRSISNEYCEEYDTIEKDLDRLESLERQNELLKKDLKEYHELNKNLEMLEILKKHYDKDSLTLSVGCFIHFYIYYKDTDFNKVKEWLENE